MQRSGAPTTDTLDPAKEDRVLGSARAYAEAKLPGRPLVAAEFGVPSIGLDDSETHFVRIEADRDRMLVRVTLYPDGRLSVDPLTAA
jgi:hypothetical protein